jgi:hypothetical protein
MSPEDQIDLIAATRTVKVSFFGLPNLPRLVPPLVAKSNGVAVASLLDLAGTKASVVQMRAEAKDYVDIDALITRGRVDLPLALSAAHAIYGASFNPQITLKALSYFDDGDLRQLPDDMKLRLASAVRSVDLGHLPRLDSMTRHANKDRDLELRNPSRLRRRRCRLRHGSFGSKRRRRRSPIRSDSWPTQ